jgi:acetolactate synthase-1/2/3 large subunit
MTKLSDYVIEFLEAQGMRDVFTVSGGGIMHLVDSLGRNRGMRFVCNHHEQACAIAAEGYARARDGVGVCLVTTGPGSTNALSGVPGAWVDSIPILVISGQVRRDLIADYSRVRQLGPQEINIEEMARPVTKTFCTLMDPLRVRFELERALWCATSGRPGPAWLNIPLDVQGATIDKNTLVGFNPPSAPVQSASIVRYARNVLSLLRSSRRPLLIPGNGIHLARASAAFQELVERWKVPVSPTLGGMDLLDDTHPYSVGRFGPIGQRHANFAVQNADLIIAIGTSMSLSTVGFNTEAFAPTAMKIYVNIDEGELTKARPAPDIAITADAREFLEASLSLPSPEWRTQLEGWWRACRQWRQKYPTVTDDYWNDQIHANSYVFADVLSKHATEADLIVTGNSLDAWSIYQSFRVRRGQRIFTNINFGAMGWDLPAAIGACISRENRRTILVTGDGSLQFNIQELQTIRHNALRIKIFVFNNKGYASIRTTQDSHFSGRLVGADAQSGVSTPSLEHLAAAYGFRYSYIATNADIDRVLAQALATEEPELCEVNIAYAQGRTPRIVSRRLDDGRMESGTLENMFPFLPADEVRSNMNMFVDDDVAAEPTTARWITRPS